MCTKRSKICHFYAEIVKVGLTHLIFLGGGGGGRKQTGRQENTWGGGGNAPMFPGV